MRELRRVRKADTDAGREGEVKVRRFVHRSGFSQCDYVEWVSGDPCLWMVKDGERQQTSIMLRDADLYLKHGTWIEMQKDDPIGKTLCEVFADEAAASAVVAGEAAAETIEKLQNPAGLKTECAIFDALTALVEQATIELKIKDVKLGLNEPLPATGDATNKIDALLDLKKHHASAERAAKFAVEKLKNLTAKNSAPIQQKSTALNQRPDDVELAERREKP